MCAPFHSLFYVPLHCFVRVAFAVCYFGCKVKHLLSCSVHREHSAAYYCTCVLCKCMPDGHCCRRCTQCCTEGGPLQGKGKRKRRNSFDFLLEFDFTCEQLRACCPEKRSLRQTKKNRFLCLSSLSIKKRICYHGNHLGENKLNVPGEVKWALNGPSVPVSQCSLSDAGHQQASSVRVRQYFGSCFAEKDMHKNKECNVKLKFVLLLLDLHGKCSYLGSVVDFQSCKSRIIQVSLLPF